MITRDPCRWFILLLALGLVLGIPSFLFGQEVFAPFASRLKAVTQEDTIVITWNDSPDISDGKYIILRMTEEITDKNFTRATQIGEVAVGVQSFIDTPPQAEVPYYYAVLIKDTGGKVYELFIPFRNKTTIPQSVKKQALPDNIADITGIRTSLSAESSVTVEFTSSANDRVFNLYASTKPILSIDSLLVATRLATFPSSQTRYVDYPLPGIPYYYAVIDAAELKSGDITFNPGQNTTREPIEVPIKPGSGQKESAFVGRSQPLPFYNISESIMEGSTLASSPFFQAQPTPLRDSTIKALGNLYLLYSTQKPESAEAVILPGERSDYVSGERQYLREIVSRSIMQKNWKEGELSLKRFLSVRRSEEIESSARFYLGEALYFQGRKTEAFFEFLLVTGHDAERRMWIDRILNEEVAAKAPQL